MKQQMHRFPLIRSFALLMFCIQFSWSQAQELKPYSPYQHLTFPFRVLGEENVWKNGRIPIKQGEPLRLKDSVELRNGSILIAHYSGKLFEFHGDTTIAISEINRKLAGEKDKLPNPYLTFLISGSAAPRSIAFFHCVIVPDPYNVIYPTRATEVNANEPACIWLEQAKPSFDLASTRFEIKNIFDESLSVFYSDTLQFELDLPKDPSGLLIIDIVETGEEYGSSIGFKLDPDRKRKLPTPCSASTPVEFLQVAVVLELGQREQYALDYYEKAKKAASWNFYDHLYEI